MTTKAKVGDTIRIIEMKGEPEYSGRVGVVDLVDGIGQLHGSWGGCAIQPENEPTKSWNTHRGKRNGKRS